MTDSAALYARIPADLHDWLIRRAQANDRTMAAELRVILRAVKNQTTKDQRSR